MMRELIPLITPEEIQKKVKHTARRISGDYQGKDLLLIGMLKGSFIFLSDLARYMDIPVRIDFMQVSSYGDGTSSGEIKLISTPRIDIARRHILLIDDIVDTGHTLAYALNYFQPQNPASIRICAFIDKHERREASISIAYSCFSIDEGFLVGYGLDYAEEYRELPGLFHLKI